MNARLTYISLMLYAACYAILFGTWVAVVFLKPTGAEALVSYIIATLGALTGHILTIVDPNRPTGETTTPPSSPTQGGYATVPGMCLVALAALLAGCAGLNVQWALAATYNTPATASATMTPGAAAPLPAPAASGVK